MSDIRKEVSGSKGRFVLDTDAGQAVMSFSIASPHSIIVDHTGVPKALEGTGLGSKLARALVEDARANDIKITPLCPFLNGWRARHPEAADVFSV